LLITKFAILEPKGISLEELTGETKPERVKEKIGV